VFSSGLKGKQKPFHQWLLGFTAFFC